MSFTEEYLINKDIQNVVHIGADRGGELPQYKNLGAKKVVWVEANPEVYGELLENLEIMNISEVESIPFNQLISDTDDASTEFNIYYGPDAGHLIGNKGMSSMLKAEYPVSECYKGTLELNALTLDTFLERNELGFDFDMVNIDTQGAEYKVLKGASKLLEKVKYINCEVTFHTPLYQNNSTFGEVNCLLESYGFKRIHVDYCTEGNWGDALYTKETL